MQKYSFYYEFIDKNDNMIYANQYEYKYLLFKSQILAV